MKNIILLFVLVSFAGYSQKSASDIAAIDNVLDNWHKAAAAGNFDGYFGVMTKDAIFIGTSPEENWNMEAFKAFSKPYFDKGKAWDFKPVERHIFFSRKGDVAWFDELLETWMKLCRGSGVLVKQNGKWMISHYVLSMTIPNDDTNGVIKLIEKNEDAYLENLKKKK